MQSEQQFSDVVEKIYDSAMDANLWPQALEAACAFVDGCAANLFYQSMSGSDVVLFHSWGEDADYRALYIETYSKLNPLFPASLFLEPGTVHQVGDLIPIDEFRDSRMYKEWVRPQGILDALYTNLERNASGAAALAIRRREADGLFDPDAKARFALIVPHVRRAVAIGKVIGFHRATEAALTTTLDRLEAAVLLVAADGRLVYANEPGASLLSAGTVLHTLRGRLAACEPKVDEDLRQAIAHAARGDDDLGNKGIALSLSAAPARSQVAHVLSLTSGSRRGVLDQEAKAAVFVYSAAFPAPAPLEIVTQLYRLTAGEVRVLSVAAEASGVREMARALGVAEATVKTHLQRLFGKTGARRQSDLIKILARFSSPLRA